MRFLIALLLVAALLLPRGGVVLAQMVGADRVTICAGATLVTVTLDAHGRPIEPKGPAETQHMPCIAAQGPAAAAPPGFAWLQAARDHLLRLPPAQAVPVRTLWHGPPPDRAPPGFV